MSIQFNVPKHRLEALVDGVFAIAMTLLVLEVKVPEVSNPSDGLELLHALQHHGYVIIAYFISFAVLGLFWVWHHRLSKKVSEIDLPLLLSTLGFLSLICFFPFTAALLGRYVFYTPVALLVYLPVVGLLLLSQTLYFYLADKLGRILPDVPAAEIRSAHRHNLYACAAFSILLAPTALMLGPIAAGSCVALGLVLGALAWRT